MRKAILPLGLLLLVLAALASYLYLIPKDVSPTAPTRTATSSGAVRPVPPAAPTATATPATRATVPPQPTPTLDPAIPTTVIIPTETPFPTPISANRPLPVQVPEKAEQTYPFEFERASTSRDVPANAQWAYFLNQGKMEDTVKLFQEQFKAEGWRNDTWSATKDKGYQWGHFVKPDGTQMMVYILNDSDPADPKAPQDRQKVAVWIASPDPEATPTQATD